MRVLLIHPEVTLTEFGFRVAAMPEPLGLELVAAQLDGHECRILDMRCEKDPNCLQRELAGFAPDVVGVTALTPEVYAALDVMQDVKRFSRDIFVFVGGFHATLMPEDFCNENVDAVALGEAEFVIRPLIDSVSAGKSLADVPNIIWRDENGQFTANGRSFPQFDMDTVPMPRRDLVDHYREQYFFLFDKPDSSMATGRGCPYRCNFCSVWEFYGGRTRQMSPRRVLREIHESVKTDHVTFVDDNFLMNHKREHEIAQRIKADGLNMRYSMECRTDSIAKHPELVAEWKEIGLYAVLLGLEGATDKALADVNKKNALETNNEAIRILHDNGVIIWGAFITDPSWGVEDFRALREYVNRMEITHTQFTVLTPLPGTRLYKEKFDELLTYDYTCFDTMHAVVPTKLPREQFYEEFANLYKQRDLGPYFDLVSAGTMSIDDVKAGKRMLDALSTVENYHVHDPVLGKTRGVDEALPSIRKHLAAS